MVGKYPLVFLLNITSMSLFVVLLSHTATLSCISVSKGEAAGIAMGLVMLGSKSSQAIDDMVMVRMILTIERVMFSSIINSFLTPSVNENATLNSWVDSGDFILLD